jgi:hypothetical protein
VTCWRRGFQLSSRAFTLWGTCAFQRPDALGETAATGGHADCSRVCSVANEMRTVSGAVASPAFGQRPCESRLSSQGGLLASQCLYYQRMKSATVGCDVLKDLLLHSPLPVLAEMIRYSRDRFLVRITCEEQCDLVRIVNHRGNLHRFTRNYLPAAIVCSAIRVVCLRVSR